MTHSGTDKYIYLYIIWNCYSYFKEHKSNLFHVLELIQLLYVEFIIYWKWYKDAKGLDLKLLPKGDIFITDIHTLHCYTQTVQPGYCPKMVNHVKPASS